MITIWVFHLLIQDPVSNSHQPAAAGALIELARALELPPAALPRDVR